MTASLLAKQLTPSDRQWLFTPFQVCNPPSVRDSGESLVEERYARAKAVHRLLLLKDCFNTSQDVIATAATFVHRFYMFNSINEYDYLILAAAAFFLACKVEEAPKQLKFIVGSSLDLDQNRLPEIIDKRMVVHEKSREFDALRTKVLFYEEVLLRTLAFDLDVPMKNAYGVMIRLSEMYFTKGSGNSAEKIARAGWLFLNDSLLGVSVLLYPAPIMAAAAIVCACAQLDFALPARPESSERSLDREEGEEVESLPYWLDSVEAHPQQVKDCVHIFLNGYKSVSHEYISHEAEQLRNKLEPILASLFT